MSSEDVSFMSKSRLVGGEAGTKRIYELNKIINSKNKYENY